MSSVEEVEVDTKTKKVVITMKDAESMLKKEDVEQALAKYPQYTVASFDELADIQ